MNVIFSYYAIVITFIMNIISIIFYYCKKYYQNDFVFIINLYICTRINIFKRERFL